MNTTQGEPFSIVYVSRALIPFFAGAGAASAEVLALASQAEASNRQANIRGVLVAACGHFLQWLHGEESRVRALMAVIAADPRHKDVVVVHEEYGPADLSEWTMTLVTKPADDEAVLRQFEMLLKGPRQGRQSPAEFVQRIVKPPPLTGPHRRQRVALFGQSALWPSTLLSSLAQRWNVEISRTRLVGMDRLERDAVLEYLDVDHATLGPLRVVNVSGSALAVPWLPRAMARIDVAVLMYSVSGVNGVQDFTESVQRHLDLARGHTPTLCMFGRTAARMEDTVKDWFAASGRDVNTAVMSLADSSTVWRSIEELVTISAGTGTVAPSWKPSTISPAVPSGDVSAPAPDMLQFSFTELVQDAGATAPADPGSVGDTALAADVATEPVGLDAGRPQRVLGAAGREWLSDLLELEAVSCVAAQDRLSGTTMLMLVQPDSPSAAGPQDGLEERFLALVSEELRLYTQMTTENPLELASDRPFVLTKFRSSIMVSFLTGAESSGVVCLFFNAGWMNEALTMKALKDALEMMPHDLFVEE